MIFDGAGGGGSGGVVGGALGGIIDRGVDVGLGEFGCGELVRGDGGDGEVLAVLLPVDVEIAVVGGEGEHADDVGALKPFAIREFAVVEDVVALDGGDGE